MLAGPDAAQFRGAGARWVGTQRGADRCRGLQVPEPPREQAPAESVCLLLPPDSFYPAASGTSERLGLSQLPAGEPGGGLDVGYAEAGGVCRGVRCPGRAVERAELRGTSGLTLNEFQVVAEVGVSPLSRLQT